MWFEPENEQGVVFLFGYLCTEHESRIRIERIGTAFPDAQIVINDIRVRVEFEYMASNFIRHGHDIRGCDLVICWQNDAPEDFPLPVWELCKDNPFSSRVVNFADPKDKELWYWKNRSRVETLEIAKLRDEIKRIEGVCEYNDVTLDPDAYPCPYCNSIAFSKPQSLSAHLRHCEVYQSQKAHAAA